MNTNNQIQDKYVIYLFRKDLQENIQISEHETLEEADKAWEELTDYWSQTLKEQVPFKMKVPYRSSFDPGLIGEIKIEFVQETKEENNPYKRSMQQKGFTAALNDHFQGGPNLLDGGYK